MIPAIIVTCWLAVLLRTAPAWWRCLNAGGACLGRSIAWWMSGGPGLWMARYHLGHLRQQQAMAELQARLAAERWRRPSAFPAGERVRMLASGGVAYPRGESLLDQLERYEELHTGWTMHPHSPHCTWE